MKKSFTLIELLVTITLAMIFMNYAFTFKLNFFEETTKLKDESNIVFKNFNLSQIITKGFKEYNLVFPGLITAQSRKDDKEFNSYYLNTNVKYDKKKIDGIERLKIKAKTEEFINEKILLSKAIKIKEADGKDSELFIVSFKLEGDTSSSNYTKLVYPK